MQQKQIKMKNKLYIIILSILTASCATLPMPESYIGVVDYAPLIKDGIFVTESNSVSFNYTAVGSIVATEKGGWINGNEVRPSTDNAFKNISKELKRVGANGIINLIVMRSVELSGDLLSKTYVPVVTIKGMAIKIQDENIKKDSSIVGMDFNILGYIDEIRCRVIERYKNGILVGTSKELSIEQIRKAKSTFNLKGMIMFCTENKIGKENAYAGIDGGYIITYKDNQFTEL